MCESKLRVRKSERVQERERDRRGREREKRERVRERRKKTAEYNSWFDGKH